MTDPLFSVKDRHIVITGASSGIGEALAVALAERGAKVMLVGRRAHRLKALQAKIGAEATSHAADLTSEAGWQSTADAALAWGPPHVLINAAGVNFREAPTEITPTSWEDTLTINLTAPFFLARALLGPMREQGWGRIINIASLQSVRAFDRGIAYGASKGGIAQLTRAMAQAWSADGVNANAIAPGFFPTELTQEVYADETLTQKLAGQTCIGRNGQLEDLIGTTIFLASPASDYVTGQVIFVDGGFTAK